MLLIEAFELCISHIFMLLLTELGLDAYSKVLLNCSGKI